MSNVIEIYGHIDNCSMLNVVSKIKELDISKPITLIITSKGGDPTSVSILKEYVEKNNIEIHTIGVDRVESAAVPIFMLGKTRKVLGDTYLLIHEPKQVFTNEPKSISDLEFSLSKLKQIKEKYVNDIQPKTTISLQEFENKISCGDWIIYPKEAKKLGFITEKE